MFFYLLLSVFSRFVLLETFGVTDLLVTTPATSQLPQYPQKLLPLSLSQSCLSYVQI